MGVHLRIHVHRLAGNVAQDRAEPSGRQDEQRQDEHADQRQPPFEGEHDHQQGDRFDEVGHDADDGIADGVLRADHVVVEAGHQLADLGIGKEAQGHALQPRKERRAQVVDDALAHRRVQPPLDDIDPAVHRRDQQQRQAEQQQPIHILGRDHHVDHLAEDERRQQGQACCQ